MSIDLARFHQSFFEESLEGLEVMEQTLLQIDLAAVDAEAINRVFRAAHSIKGGAATFGFSGIADFTHGVETLLDEMRSGRRTIRPTDIDLLLQVVDVLRGLIHSARDGGEVDTAAIARVRAGIDATLATTSESPPPQVLATVAAPAMSDYRIRFVPKPGLFRTGNDPLLVLRGLEALGPLQRQCLTESLPRLIDADPEDCYLAWELQLQTEVSRAAIEAEFAWIEDDCELRIEPWTGVAEEPVTTVSTNPPPPRTGAPQLTLVQGGAQKPAAAAHTPPAPHAPESSIRVGTEKIDALINLVGELVITQAMLMQQANLLDPVHHEKLLAGLGQLDRNTRQLQEAVMSTRMLPIESVFSRFPRVVRDLAGRLAKQARLVTVGEATELDKSVIEKIADPLTHLVRNSLDHGIELPEERQAAGKDPVGTIRLTAAHQGGYIVVEVSDDGRGLDRERILARAAANGLAVSPAMSDAEVWQLIFAPGFSTAEQVTDVSGRGVGMDVVKRNIAVLGGSVELHSQQGQGSRTVIRLPLTLAILDGMSVAVGPEIFVLPLSSVVESLQPSATQVKRVAGSAELLRVRDEYVPMLGLGQLFGFRSDTDEATRSILVVVEAEGRKLALQVDALVGQQQVVIKSLEDHFRRVPCISGATILGDGRVALILDVADLVRTGTRAAAA
jgi:two-component system chemotaxis sensor kinase CheA